MKINFLILSLLEISCVPFVQAGKEKMENKLSEKEEERSESSSSENELPKEKKIGKTSKKNPKESLNQKRKKLDDLVKAKENFKKEFDSDYTGNKKIAVRPPQNNDYDNEIEKIESRINQDPVAAKKEGAYQKLGVLRKHAEKIDNALFFKNYGASSVLDAQFNNTYEMRINEMDDEILKVKKELKDLGEAFSSESED